MNIHETNEAAKAAGMTYGQYVLQTEEPVTPAPTEEPANEPTDTETRTCRMCGKTFLVDLNDGRKKKKIYCSKDCNNAAVRDRSKARKKETPDVSLIQAENRALRTELATNHLGDGNKKVPDQEAKADSGKPRLTLVPPRIIMNAVKFTLPYPPTKRGKAAWNKRFSLNAYWAGKHYRQRAQDARDIHSLVILALRQGRVKKQPFQGPVEVVFRWDDGLDVDNHAAIGKMVVDAMKGWVIQDDSPRWVRRVVHEFWDGGCVGVEVRGMG